MCPYMLISYNQARRMVIQSISWILTVNWNDFRVGEDDPQKVEHQIHKDDIIKKLKKKDYISVRSVKY